MVEDTNTNQLTQPQTIPPQPPFNENLNQLPEPPPPQKSNNWLTISIVLIAVLALGAASFFAYQYYQLKNSQPIIPPEPYPIETKPTPKPTNTISTASADISSWITYTNPYHKFAFMYPNDLAFEVSEDIGHDPEPGQYGAFVFRNTPPAGEQFNVHVIYTTEWTIIGNLYGDVDVLEAALKSGGIQQVAKLSRDVNLKPRPLFPNKQVGELEEFKYADQTGYGFNVTKTFSRCFNVDHECRSGEVINTPTTFVYVTNGTDVYLIRFENDSIGDQILPTFRFAD